MANTTYVIPPGEDNWLRLDEYPGTETVFMVASEDPLPNLTNLSVSLQGLTREKVLKKLSGQGSILKVLNFRHQ